MRPKRLLMTLITLALAYGNLSVALAPPALLRVGLSLPAPAWLRDTFLMTGMFNSYTERNLDFVLAGERSQQGFADDRGRWIRLPLRDHFTGRHGITYTQLFAAHHWDAHGRQAQHRAWAVLAAKIRQRHNRLHPEREIVRVRIGVTDWPISPRGYWARKADESGKPRTWFVEDPH